MSDEPRLPERDPPEPPAPLGATPPPLESLPTPAGAGQPPPHRRPMPGSDAGPVTRRRPRGGSRRAFDFGRVLGGTFQVYFKKLPSILLLSAVIAGPVGILQVLSQRETLTPGAPDELKDVLGGMGVMFGALALEQLAVLILAGALAYLVVRHQQGRSVGLGEALGRGFTRLLPVLGTGLLVGVITLAAFVPGIVALTVLDSPGLSIVLFLAGWVPAVMFMFSAYVAVPACAVEKTGPVESIRRSRALCIGHRWLIFVLALVVGLIGGAISVVGTVPFAVGGHIQLSLWVGKLVQVLVISPLGAILAAMIYVELRAVKEGVDPDGIAEVFS